MMRSVLAAAFAFAASPAFAQTAIKPAVDPHAGHVMTDQQPATKPDNPAIPPDNAASAARLTISPRHGEWVDIKMPSGGAL